MSRAALWIAAAACTLGCSVPYGAALGVQQVNTCSASRDCAEGAACSDGVCVATDVDLTGTLIEVRPHASASFGATTSYLFDPHAKLELSTHGQSAQPFLGRLDPQLPPTVSIKGGKVLMNKAAQAAPPPGCPITDLSVPAQITFFRVPPFAGLPFDPIRATTTSTKDFASSTFDVDLVPDTYDVYIQPQPVMGCPSLPPRFLPAQPITGGTVLSWELPIPGTLTGHIVVLSDVAPGDFAIDLVEPTRGLPISADGQLVASGDGFDLTAQIAWVDQTIPILRLMPVDPAKALPSVYWTLAGSVFGGSQTAPHVEFTVADLFTGAIPVSGQVQAPDGSSGGAASIFIQSTKLMGPDAQNATYAVSRQTDAQGNFTVPLPPGTYQFRTVPEDERFAVTDLERPINGDPNDPTKCMCGIPLQLWPRAMLTGTARTPTLEELVGASVGTSPSQTVSTSYWLDTHAIDPVSTRAATTITDGMGQFHLLVDPGSSDLTIQPGAASNYPWLVRPRFTFQGDAQPPPFTLTSPAFISGTVTDPQNMPVMNAEINAWFPVRDSSGGLTGTVVKIATTSTSTDGTFTLVLPSQI